MRRFERSYLYAAALTVAFVAGSLSPAQAIPTATIDGITFPVGIVPGGNTLQSGILNESLITGPGQTLMGDGRVDSINNSSSDVVWQNGQNGVELAFVFNDYTSNMVTAPTPTTAGQVTFTGGVLDFYVLPANTDINNPNLTAAQNMAVVESGTLFLSETAAVEDASGDTLLATLPANSTLLSFGTASGFGFLDVSGGPAALNFNTNTFADAYDTGNGGFADQSFTSDFSSGASGAFPIAGSGTIKANAVPEPASLSVLGLGLLGVGLAKRRRRS